MNPRITVIIPAYNSARTIGTAIQSILDQTYSNLEVLVIDDNSTDATNEVVGAFVKKDRRVSYHKLPYIDPNRVNKKGRNINAGYMARNYGFEKARGELITFQDADDASFKNRIEYQLELLKKHGAMHVTLDWQMLREDFIGKRFDADRFAHKPEMIGPKELSLLATAAKGILPKIIGKFHSSIDFEIKRSPVINKLFFGSLAPYPGTGNSPLFKREVIEKVRFRKLADRVWPSFTGRGADRDFNFQVAETFKNSYVFFVPLYMWRQREQNERYKNIDLSKFLS
jgi:glycosyltransferase involved in cell wall biosynthesis